MVVSGQGQLEFEARSVITGPGVGVEDGSLHFMVYGISKAGIKPLNLALEHLSGIST